MPLQQKRCQAIYIAAVVGGLICLGMGFLIGWLAAHGNIKSKVWREDLSVSDLLLEHISSYRIRENLKWFSSTPGLAGTRSSHDKASYLATRWREQGLEDVSTHKYKVLLSYPPRPPYYNKIEILNANRSSAYEYKAVPHDKLVPSNITDRYLWSPYNAYAAAGTVEGDLVYVNYGLPDDIEFIQKTHNITISGKIVLARLGYYPPSLKAKTAAEYGAIGAVLFVDPYHLAEQGHQFVYPDGAGLPGDGVPRSSLHTHLGDPLTPNYPATDYAVRLDQTSPEATGLTTIPVQTVGYDVGRKLLAALDPSSPLVPDTWKSQPEEDKRNVTEDDFSWPTMRIGGALADGKKIRLTVNNSRVLQEAHNVCGTIRGRYEPDRIILVGSHRDAWVSGAVDPGGGTAALMELVTVYTQQLKRGWRPGRSIMFCSWDAEEFGLIGSAEFVQHHETLLMHQAVAYINLDIIVMGVEHLAVMASPMLTAVITSAAKKVPHPSGNTTLFDTWMDGLRKRGIESPRVEAMTPVSDHTLFFFWLGIPSSSIYFTKSPYTYYHSYHTEYDTYDYVSRFLDHTFQYHRSVAQLTAEMLRSLADRPLLTFDLRDYATLLKEYYTQFRLGVRMLMKSNYFDHKQGLQLQEDLLSCISKFSIAAYAFHTRLTYLDLTNSYQLRLVNDRLMMVEKAFLDSHWNTNFTIFRHVIMTPGTQCPGMFPGIRKALCDMQVYPLIQTPGTRTLPPQAYYTLKYQFAVICTALDRATQLIQSHINI